MFGHFRMRGPHKRVGVTARLADSDEIDRLMHSNETTVSGDCYSVFKVNFNIPNLALYLIKAKVDFPEPFIHLFFYLFKSSIRLFLHFAELRRNKLTSTEKLLLQSLVVGVKGPT